MSWLVLGSNHKHNKKSKNNNDKKKITIKIKPNQNIDALIGITNMIVYVLETSLVYWDSSSWCAICSQWYFLDGCPSPFQGTKVALSPLIWVRGARRVNPGNGNMSGTTVTNLEEPMLSTTVSLLISLLTPTYSEWLTTAGSPMNQRGRWIFRAAGADNRWFLLVDQLFLS